MSTELRHGPEHDEIKRDKRREWRLLVQALVSFAVVAAVVITRELLLR